MSKLKEELLNLEHEEIGAKLPMMDFIYLIPMEEKHDSGYNYIIVIGENRDGYKKILSYSDVIDINEILTKRHQYCTLSIDIPEYDVIKLFSQNKFDINYYGISTFSFDLVEVE